MARTRRTIPTLVAVGAAALVALGVGGALAQSDTDGATGAGDGDLLDRLEAIERDLPLTLPVEALGFSADDAAIDTVGDAAGTRALLDLVEGDLRALYVSADDAAGPVADGVALVTRGWLDVWNASEALAIADAHDLAFPTSAVDDLGAQAGADTLRGEIAIGVRLLADAHEQLLDGYRQLEETVTDRPDLVSVLAERRAQFEFYDEELAPELAVLLGRSGTTLVIPVDRFETDAPGVRSRAGSLGVLCVDREVYEAVGGVVDETTIDELTEGVNDRVDCPDLGLPEVDPDEFEPASASDDEDE
ncbi:MAG: hypothetical protein JJT89_09670 [Nitriliruptoraceae bacterium]|nr:hypothetical protein [Nitriliruptoraceae bacterium]